MATVYKIEIVSDWINYTEEQLKKLIEENLDPDRQTIRVTEVKRVTKEVIEVLGVKHYTEEYLKEMMRREYDRGVREGQQVHVAQIEKCTNGA